jgi:hypothetical protein
LLFIVKEQLFGVSKHLLLVSKFLGFSGCLGFVAQSL